MNVKYFLAGQRTYLFVASFGTSRNIADTLGLFSLPHNSTTAEGNSVEACAL